MARRALLVGINNFRPGIQGLRGCINDTHEMGGLLREYFGFQEQDIKVLHDADATAQRIREGLGWLLSDYDGDDVRVFHFSSHGTQVDDQGDDEWECLDEVIVTYDHDWDHPFRDDDLREIFLSIPANVNFSFIADCCHSGSIQKALLDSEVEFEPRYLTPPSEIVDAIDARLAKRDTEAHKWASKEMLRVLRETPEEEWDAMAETYLDELLKRYRQNKYGVVEADRHILLAACEDRQTAADARIEGEWRGAFTWALGRAIQEGDRDLTYDQLIKRAGTNLRGFAQRPQLESPPDVRKLKVFAPLAQA
jgi:hypothetical protein